MCVCLAFSSHQKAGRSAMSLIILYSHYYTHITIQKTVVAPTPAPTKSPAVATRKKDESSSSEESDSEDEAPAKPATGVKSHSLTHTNTLHNKTQEQSGVKVGVVHYLFVY